MDLLSKRYASPFSMLDNLIHAGQFEEWVEYFLNKQAREDDDKKMWEFFLHKIYDKSFDEWKSGTTSGESGSSDNGAMNEAKKEEIIKRSANILNGFNPSAA